MVKRARRVGAGVLLTLALATPAFAASSDGSWNSSFSEWLTGKESRQWTDNAKYQGNTTIKLSGCTYNSPSLSNLSLQLHRADTWTPDENYEVRKYNCTSGSKNVTNTWGNKGAGKFYFHLYAIQGRTDGAGWMNASANSVAVSY